MKLELVGVYPIPKRQNKKQVYIATAHFYIIDIGLDIRGVLVKKYNNKFFIAFPTKKAYDPEAKKVVTYPCLRFTDTAKHKQFLITCGKLLRDSKLL